VPSANHLLTDVLSKEPLGPVVRGDDHQWFEIVRWVLNVLVAAEEMEGEHRSGEPDSGSDAAVLAGLGDDRGGALGLEPGWAARVVGQVGTYGAIFDRHLGKGSALGLDRGLNDLWTRGGLMYAPPLQ
jgi:general L-amino acid transport system substrate-binding protein